MRTPIALLAALFSVTALTAQAETDLAPGSFLRQTRHWDSDMRKFLPGADKGEEAGCWQVVALGEVTVTLKHVSGTIHPTWSDKPVEPGATEEWFDSAAFREESPGKPPLTQMRNIFETVASCHETP
ncbi:MAG TPA: hypothetical protein PLI13_04815 [Paracoccus sp. (in: a-proteobacteria)]|jgi:hypothetical protein|nr:hypothetical protein [Paracoccus sp. (in: a-proteobacteria)]HRM74016.1 hypothetical protein [Paracoccus sp. (in: a-proteobacteria)]